MAYYNIGSVGIGGSGGGGGGVTSVNGDTGPAVILDKSDIGLGNVDNVSVLDILQTTRQLTINAAEPEEPGIRYQSYANALTYLNGTPTGGAPSFSNKYVCIVEGTLTENITLQAYVYLGSVGQSGAVNGLVQPSTSTAFEAHRVFDLLINRISGNVVNTLVEIRNSTITDQTSVSVAGDIWLRSCTVFAAGASANMSFGNLECTEGTQLREVANFNRISLRTGSYCTFIGSPTGGILNLYDGAATVNLTDGQTLTINQMYCYTGNFYGSGFGFGTNPIVRIIDTASYPSELFNSTLYGVNFQIEGVGGILKVRGTLKGENTGVNRSTFTEAASGVLEFEGDTFEDSRFTSEDTVGAIKELADTQTIPVKFEKTLVALDITNQYVDLLSDISPASTEDVEVIGAPNSFREGVDYTVVTNNRINWNVGGSLLDANLAAGDIIVVRYERAI